MFNTAGVPTPYVKRMGPTSLSIYGVGLYLNSVDVASQALEFFNTSMAPQHAWGAAHVPRVGLNDTEAARLEDNALVVRFFSSFFPPSF